MLKRLLILAIYTAVGLGVVALAGAIVWHARQQARTFYTDGQTFSEPISRAKVRQVLWSPARALDASVNTAEPERQPCISADGGSLLLTRSEAGGQADLYMASRAAGDDANAWSAPQPLIDLNTSANEISASISHDGRTIYFASDRDGGLGGYDIWVSHRGEYGWLPPVNPGESINSAGNEIDPAISPDGRSLLFASNRALPGDPPGRLANPWPGITQSELKQRDYDLYEAEIFDEHLKPAVPLVALNTWDNEGSPALSPAGDFIYFSSDRQLQHVQSGFDIYRARIKQGEIQIPENLGSSVNSDRDELDPTVSSDGFVLHFSSDRKIALGDGEAAASEWNVHYSVSREVYSDIVAAGALDWASIWSALSPGMLWLLLALLAIALLLLVAAMLKSVRNRKLSLLARCLLASLIAHLMMLILMTFWQVSSSLNQMLDRPGAVQVALIASPPAEANGDELYMQVRGGLTSVELDALQHQAQRLQAEMELAAEPQPVALSAEESAEPADRSMVASAQPADALPEFEELPDAASPQPLAAANIDVASIPAPQRTQSPEAARSKLAAAVEESHRDRQADAVPTQRDVDDPAPVAMTPERSEAAKSTETLASTRQVQEAAPRETVPAPQPADVAVNVQAPTLQMPQASPARTAQPQLAMQGSSIQAARQSAPAQSTDRENNSVALAPGKAAQPKADALLVNAGAAGPAAESTTPGLPANNIMAAVAVAQPSEAAEIAAPRDGVQPPARAPERQMTLRGGAIEIAPQARVHRNEVAPATSVQLQPHEASDQHDDETRLASKPDERALTTAQPGAAVEISNSAALSEAPPLQVALATPAAAQQQATAAREASPDLPMAKAETARTAQPLITASSSRLKAIELAPTTSGESKVHEPATLAAVHEAALDKTPAARSDDLLAGQLAEAPWERQAVLPSIATPAGAAQTADRPERQLALRSASVRAQRHASAEVPQTADSAVSIAPERSTASASAPSQSLAGLESAQVAATSVDMAAPKVELALSNPSAPDVALPLDEGSSRANDDPETRRPLRADSSSALRAHADARPAQQSSTAVALAPQAKSAAQPEMLLRAKDAPARLDVESSNPAQHSAPAALAAALEAADLPQIALPAGDAKPERSPESQQVVAMRPSSMLPSASRSDVNVNAAPRQQDAVALAPEPGGSADGSAETNRSLAAGYRAAESLAAAPRQAEELAMLPAIAAADVSIDIKIPIEEAPPANPYPQRAEEKRMELVQKGGGSEETEKAVALALEWLARHQSEDGRWAARAYDENCGLCAGRAKFDTDVATTGLALLCFLGADHTHFKDGPYREHVRKGVAWLISQQQGDGDWRGGETMYSHGIATIAACEAFAMTGDPQLKPYVERGIDYIWKARNRTTGGWRYEPGQVGDTSVLGWQMMALMSAKRAGFDVPPEAFDMAKMWLDLCSTPTRPGLYAYQPGQRFTPSMTAEGMFIQQLSGRDRVEERMKNSADFLMEHLPQWRSDQNSYFWYYGTLALFQHQGEHWKHWNDALTKQLLSHQQKEGPTAGSWDPFDNWAKIGGRVYQTALCTLCLEVYYRYLPMYAAVEEEPREQQR